MAASPKPEESPAQGPEKTEDLRDLGFGSRVLDREHTRFLNRDGTFNVVRLGLPWWKSLNLYHTLVTCSWWTFYGLLCAGYLAVNLLFAAGYLACGPDALAGADSITIHDRFFDAFFFSVQTLATIGYGALSPRGLAANVLVAIEALMGLLGVALATGLSFSRFARPQARIRFAERAVVAPYKDGWGFMFRLANERSSQLVEVQATVVLSLLVEGAAGQKTRKFVPCHGPGRRRDLHRDERLRRGLVPDRSHENLVQGLGNRLRRALPGHLRRVGRQAHHRHVRSGRGDAGLGRSADQGVTVRLRSESHEHRNQECSRPWPAAQRSHRRGAQESR